MFCSHGLTSHLRLALQTLAFPVQQLSSLKDTYFSRRVLNLIRHFPSFFALLSSVPDHEWEPPPFCRRSALTTVDSPPPFKLISKCISVHIHIFVLIYHDLPNHLLLRTPMPARLGSLGVSLSDISSYLMNFLCI